ncbi:MAG: orotidine-5'-phosphate decarboxylase [Simkaniaceae bacterium]|nr:orotidine-5'-phosphate decarboxylase [Simkaniaceae bacterium]
MHPLTKKLRTIMETKKTNLCLSADLTNADALLHLIDEVGPHIAIVKTHIDILEDFSQNFIDALLDLKEKHNFLIFEDRKFADIGNTVVHQYKGGMYHIAKWADIINAHIVPGPGIIEGLKKVGLPLGRGLLLLAQMSSKETLASGDYTKRAVELAEEHSDFVMGFIALEKLTDDPNMIHMTPGVKKEKGKDPLGQQYLTPDVVIGKRKSDIIIVGRGIYGSPNPAKEAAHYQALGMKARNMIT